MDCLRNENEILDISSLGLDLIGAYSDTLSGASPNSEATSSYFDQLGYSSSQLDINSDSIEYINPSLFVNDYTEAQRQSIDYENELTKELDSATILAKSGIIEKRYGPIVVRPRANPAPTLGNGRKSKYVQLSPEEAQKREIRRQRNRRAAEKCKQKRNEIERNLNVQIDQLSLEHVSLASQVISLEEEKYRLERMLETHQTDYNLKFSLVQCCCSNNSQTIYSSCDVCNMCCSSDHSFTRN